MRIEFTHDEIRRWAYAGVDRRVSAMAANRQGAHGFDRSDFWQLDLEGLLAEAAVAKALNVHYSPVTGMLDAALGDVLPGIQVRSTRYDTGSLLVHKTDADSDRFILVTGQSGTYDIRGWVFGREGKNESLWKVYKRRGAYWVPQELLRPFKPKELIVRADAA